MGGLESIVLLIVWVEFPRLKELVQLDIVNIFASVGGLVNEITAHFIHSGYFDSLEFIFLLALDMPLFSVYGAEESLPGFEELSLVFLKSPNVVDLTEDHLFHLKYQ